MFMPQLKKQMKKLTPICYHIIIFGECVAGALFVSAICLDILMEYPQFFHINGMMIGRNLAENGLIIIMETLGIALCFDYYDKFCCPPKK